MASGAHRSEVGLARRLKLREEDLTQLEQLHERALNLRKLEYAAKEAQLDRDELIVDLMNLGRVSGVLVAEEAGLTRAWPGKIRGYHRERARRWRSEHPDRLGVLREARDLLSSMIEEAEDDA